MTSEVAREAGLSQRTVQRAVADRDLPAYRCGDRYVVDTSTAAEWVAEHRRNLT